MNSFILMILSLLTLVQAAHLHAARKTITIHSIINHTEQTIQCFTYLLESITSNTTSESFPDGLQSVCTRSRPDRVISVPPNTKGCIEGTLVEIKPNKFVERGHERLSLIFSDQQGREIQTELAFGRRSYFDGCQSNIFDGVWIEVKHRGFAVSTITDMDLAQIGEPLSIEETPEGKGYDVIFEHNLVTGLTYRVVPSEDSPSD